MALSCAFTEEEQKWVIVEIVGGIIEVRRSFSNAFKEVRRCISTTPADVRNMVLKARRRRRLPKLPGAS